MNARMKFLVGLVAYTVVIRLLPYFLLSNHDHTTNPIAYFYPWNFVPLMALCLYSGANVGNRLWSIAPPLVALLISDLGIWAVTGQFSRAFPSDHWSGYVCYLAAVLMGSGLNRRPWPIRAVDALGRGVLAEAMFFVVTNFAYFLTQNDLAHTPAGLMACYVAAIPFAAKSFISTALYSVLFFSPIAEVTGGNSMQRPQSELSPAEAN